MIKRKSKKELKIKAKLVKGMCSGKKFFMTRGWVFFEDFFDERIIKDLKVKVNDKIELKIKKVIK